MAFVDGGEVERGPGDTTRELQHRGYIRQWKKQTRLVPQSHTYHTEQRLSQQNKSIGFNYQL